MNYNELNFDAVTRERELSMSAAFPVLMRKVLCVDDFGTGAYRCDSVWCGY